jgi:Amt family ammonium transporter
MTAFRTAKLSGMATLASLLYAIPAWAQTAATTAAPAADAAAPAAAAAAPAAAAAAPAAAATAASAINSGDTAWMLTSTALVLMMTIPGLGLFYAGMVRKKNVLATLMQAFAITCIVTVLWYVIGYSAAFTNDDPANPGKFIGSFAHAFLNGVNVNTTNSLAPTIPEYVFSMFQMTFAIITPALIAGAFAERMKFSALIIFMSLWLLFVYTPIAHWVWGGGFLGGLGVLDFAGGTVVHINAGVAGLVCALVLGKRKGFGTVNMAPHNLVLSVIGASLLWVGWFGFNAGSAVASNALAGAAMMNTQVATAAAGLAWMFVEWFVVKKPSVLGIISGAVAGLVAVTPASGFVNPTGAFVIGIVAGAVCYYSAAHLKKMLGYDDSLDAFGVHGVGGIIGALLTGVFADASINSLGATHSIVTQAEGVIVTIVWTAVVTWVILMITKMLVGLRPSEQDEEEGLDISQHGESVNE